jgi:glycosyltransferase involved in cell wall biosynthesis
MGASAGGGILASKRVAVIGTRGYPSYYGGFETAVRKLAPFLSKRGWEVVVYGRDGSTKENDPDRDVSVQTVTTRGLESKSLSTLSYGFTATLDALRRRPDVALVMNVANGYFLPLLKLRGIRTLVNVDGIEWDRAKWGRLAKWVFKTGAWFTARFADDLVFDSKEIERRWSSEFKRTGTFIPYGGDRVPSLPVPDGLVHRGYLLAVARFVPENTIPAFLDAAPTLAEHFPVVIVGSSGYGGELDERVAELAAENSNVIWMGHLSDDQKLHALWQHAGVYFHGHSVGGTNPTLVQAMAAGSPIVARDTVYNREVLGDSGKFVDPNSASIREGIMALMSDESERDQQGEALLARSRDQYTWESVCDDYGAALEALLPAAKR